MVAAVRIGTSGWSYRHWREKLYPRDLPQSRWLEHYSSAFDTVELDGPFYRLPERSTFESWANRVPADFIFAVKASRYITHTKKILDIEAPLHRMFDRYSGLGGKLGPVLFQFPPRWSRNTARLKTLLDLIPPEHRCAFEFRDASWLVPETFAILERHGAALCIADSPHYPRRISVTAPFTFIRMHGSSAICSSDYTEDELSKWARMIAHDFRDAGIDVYVYFNNDANGYAVNNAIRLLSLLGQTTT